MMNIFEKIHELAEKGFLCEIVTDGWANWEFIDSKPDHSSATPRSGYDVCFRGCFWYFTKDGNLMQDDVGCFDITHGGAKSAFKELIKTYEDLKEKIDPDGFKIIE